MELKRKLDSVLNNWSKNRKQALLVDGARQVGKTHTILRFAKTNYSHVIYLNFAEHNEWIDSFAKLPNSDTLLAVLSLYDGANLVPHETLIFLDEIQLVYKRKEDLRKQGEDVHSYSDIVTAMKSFVEKGAYRFILSGSLLGVYINDILLDPVGYMDEVTLHPLDFEEYLWAKGVGEEAISLLRSSFIQHTPIPDALHSRFLSLFHEYILVGGMPEAVDLYITTENFQKVQTAQRQIVRRYQRDITAYTEETQTKLHIRELYDAIPSEINSKNKRFMSSHVVERKVFRNISIEDAFLWLVKSGVAIPTYNVTEARLPLSLSSERKVLKLFYNDTGLLTSSLLDDVSCSRWLSGDIALNYGAPFENMAAQILSASGFGDFLYYFNSKKMGEVDFLVENSGYVLPIEIKSGKAQEDLRYNHAALDHLLQVTPDIPCAFVFGETNISSEGDKIWYYPIYLLPFLKKNDGLLRESLERHFLANS